MDYGKGETGVKYLCINHYNKYKCKYHVSVHIKNKQFTVWRGNELDIGTRVAEKVQDLMEHSTADFLDWYDYNREEWLEYHGYKNARC